MLKTVVTITGIRPDFIRMSQVFKELDANFNHILVHTGQHYDTNLSGVFFEQLNIRKPDYVLSAGTAGSNHYEQLSYLSTAVPHLFLNENIKPDLIMFLGDSNSAAVALPLKKEGYKIAHIEAGMRSYDKRMLEELNRIVCDHCSDILFVYHDDYKAQLAQEGITKNVHVVGNTIVEPLSLFKPLIATEAKKGSQILVDIHRPENTKYPERLKAIFRFANEAGQRYNLPVKMLYFKRLADTIASENLDIGAIEMIPLMGYTEYLTTVYNSPFIISDSGTGQEEPALLDTPVIVPRDFTERPQSYAANCSKRLPLDETADWTPVWGWLDSKPVPDASWLGNGNTASQIIEHLKEYFAAGV
jgi:UDP-N-acetylglucosamine 2-epimerase